jgi:hypothetical protein
MSLYFKRYNWIVPAALAGFSFLFFQVCYPYHLFFKEQIQLFLYAPGYIISYFDKPAGLAACLGDFLTQFFYLRGGGATVLALLFGVEWLLSAVVIKRITSTEMAGLWAMFPVLTDWVLHCDTLHNVSVSVGFIVTLCLFLIYRSASKRRISYAVLAFITITGYWLVGSLFLIFPFLVVANDAGTQNPAWLKWLIVFAVVFTMPLILRHHYLLTPTQSYIFPAFSKQSLLLPLALPIALTGVFFLKKFEQAHFRLIQVGLPCLLLILLAGGLKTKANINFEKILSLDGETYFGNPDRVIELSKKYKLENRQASYFTNMALARKGLLAESLMEFYQPSHMALFLPVDPAQHWQFVFVSNEVFYRIGDMNMAQHSAMLGNTFSPYTRSSRMMKRLAEINMVNSDSAAATKYLRILTKTLFHRKWAEDRLSMIRLQTTDSWLTEKRKQIPTADMLRKSGDHLESLRFLAEQNPDNQVAVDYLLCYLLLDKDLKSFREGFDRYYRKLYQPVPKVYAEALLVQLLASGASVQEAMSYSIDPETVKQFAGYTRIFDRTSGDINALKKQFGQTYWFYYHFASIQKK